MKAIVPNNLPKLDRLLAGLRTGLCLGVVISLVAMIHPAVAQAEGKKAEKHSGEKPKSGEKKAEGKKPEGKKDAKHAAGKEGGKESGKEGGEGEKEAKKAAPVEHKAVLKSLDTELVRGKRARVVLALDSSRSMQRNDPKNLRNQGAKLFLRFLNEGDEIAILQFDSETKVVADFTKITTESIPELDAAIDAIPAEGNWTDLESPVAKSYQMLNQGENSNGARYVVLLTDGKMDPQPSRGDASSLTETVLKSDLPLYRSDGVRLYTLGLGGEADNELLKKMADIAGGQSWAASDAGMIQLKFSELFLALKKSQENVDAKSTEPSSGIEIGKGTAEVTFVVTRSEDSAQQVVLVDPKGKEISTLTLPVNVRWFSGETFEVVTIQKPLAGLWRARGAAEVPDAIRVLPALGIQLYSPRAVYTPNSEMELLARLTNEGQPIPSAELNGIVFLNVKLIDPLSNQVVSSADMRDDGEGGDATAHDGVFTANVHLEKAGEFAVVASASSPTFTKFEQTPITVTKAPLALDVQSNREFAAPEEQIVVKFTPAVAALTEKTVTLTATEIKSGDSEDYELPGEGAEYQARGSELGIEPGSYELSVKVEGLKTDGSKATFESNTLHYQQKNVADEHVRLQRQLVAERKVRRFGVVGILLLVALPIALGVISRIILRKTEVAKPSELGSLRESAIPAELLSRIDTLRRKVSADRRQPLPEELEIFHLVKDVFPPPEPITDAAVVGAEPVVGTPPADTAATETPVSADPQPNPDAAKEAHA